MLQSVSHHVTKCKCLLAKIQHGRLHAVKYRVYLIGTCKFFVFAIYYTGIWRYLGFICMLYLLYVYSMYKIWVCLHLELLGLFMTSIRMYNGTDRPICQKCYLCFISLVSCLCVSLHNTILFYLELHISVIL